MVHGFYQRDHSYLYRGQNNKTNRTDPTHWDNEESNNNGSRTAGQEPNPNHAPSVNNEPYTPSADMVALQNQIIHGLQQNVTTPAPDSRSAQGDSTSAPNYTYEEVEINGSSYYKVTDKDGNESYISPYVYHNKIENNPNGDIAGIIKDYGKSNPNEEKNYSINSDGNYVYTTEDSDTKYQEQVKDKDGNLLYTTTDVYNPKDGKTTSTTENADGSKTVTITDENDYVVSKTTYDKDGNVVDSYTAPEKSDSTNETESAYAKAKREAQEKEERESGKAMDEPETDLSQDVPDYAKELPTNDDNKSENKPKQEQPLDEPKTDLSVDLPEDATNLPDNVPTPPPSKPEPPLEEPSTGEPSETPSNPTGETNPPLNNNNPPSNNEEDDPIYDGGELPEVVVTPETNPDDTPSDSDNEDEEGTNTNDPTTPLDEPETDLSEDIPDGAKTLPPPAGGSNGGAGGGGGSGWDSDFGQDIKDKYGNPDGTINTDALTNDWVNAGGTATTYTNNGDGTWSQSDWSPSSSGEDWSWTGFDVFSTGGGGGGGGGFNDFDAEEQARREHERLMNQRRQMMQVDTR